MRIRIFVICALLLAVVRCGSGGATSLLMPLVIAQGTSATNTVRIEKKTVRRSVEQSAQNVEALHSAPLHTRLSAYVGKMHVDIGDTVKKGDLLVDLSVPEVEAELQQKEAEARSAAKTKVAADANLTSATAAVSEAKAGRQRAEAEFARAQSQYDRLSRAGRSGAIDRESVAESRFTFESAKAGVGEVEAKVKSMEAHRDESEAKRDSAQAQVEVAKARVQVAAAYRSYGKITAPFDGIVTQRSVDEGSFVQPSSGALVTVDHVAQLRVFVHLPESEARWVAAKPEGLKARVRGQALGGAILTGVVKRSAFALDPKTRTLRTEIIVDNPDRTLRPGMFVIAAIEAERQSVWALPASAVRQKDGDVWCFVNDGGTAKRRRLEIGLEGGGLIEVLRIDGKEPAGEAVVANPATTLKDGDALK